MPNISPLRKELHQHPELSGQEFETPNRIKTYIQQLHPTTIIDQIGGTGIAAIYEYSTNGLTVMIRCELDALPIHEKNNFEHKSIHPGISHKCGHDGHMAILLALSLKLKEKPFPIGKVILLFQPAEETGQGADHVIQDPKFKAFQPDYIFALHNIPGAPLHQIIKMETGFSAEVISFAVRLTGKKSHAAEPENGINPAFAVACLIPKLDQLKISDPLDNNFAVLTPIHISVGQQSYGVSPAHGELHYTIRTWSQVSMTNLKKNIIQIIDDIASEQSLEYKIDWFEHFPASQNNIECNQYITKAANQNSLSLVERRYPFTFGEDFGWYSKKYKSAMFGLGAGENSPALHHEDYDFPDEIIETGAKMFYDIITHILVSK